MYNFNSKFCPRCKNSIPDDRAYEAVIVCPDCGYTDSKRQREFHNKVQNKTISVFVIFSIIISVLYIHTARWDKYSMEIIPLKIKEATSTMSIQDFKDMARICNARMLYTCVVESYSQWVNLDPNDLEALSVFAKTLEATQRDKQALDIYGKYFSKGGEDIDLAYNYAKLLTKFEQFTDAKKYFEFVLDSKPEVFQITVSKDYVSLLMKNDQLKEAKSYILKIRKRGVNSPFFMDSELKEIKKRLVIAAR